MPTPSFIRDGDWVKAMAENEKATAERIAKAYANTLQAMENAQRPVTEALENPLSTNFGIALQRFRGVIERELDLFVKYASGEIESANERAVTIGQEAALEMAKRSLNNGVLPSNWIKPNPETLKRFVGYIDNTVLKANIEKMAGSYAQLVSDYLLTSVVQGRNPRTIANELARYFKMPYNEIENYARTTQIWSQRTATHAGYQANRRIVKGWMWISALDTRTCIACVMKHGTIYSVDEILNDHYRGRCTPLPIVEGADWWQEVELGSVWFAKQSEDKQRGHFANNALYAKWQRGEVGNEGLVKSMDDPIFGTMIRVTSARELNNVR